MSKRPREEKGVVRELLDRARGDTEPQERDRETGGKQRRLLRVKEEQEEKSPKEASDNAAAEVEDSGKRLLDPEKEEKEEVSPTEDFTKEAKEEKEEESPKEDSESEAGFDVYECEVLTKKGKRQAKWQPYPFHSFIIFR